MPEPIIHQRFDPAQGNLSYYTYDTLTRILHELVAAYPHLATLESIGKSLEGRELWLVTLTNQATGPALEKPAYWIDGNTHAGEVTGSTVVLYTIWLYLSQYGQDAKITRVLDRSAIYLLPRISVDGAEKHLTTPYWLRSNKLFNWWGDNTPTDNRTSLEWVVSGPIMAQVELTVRAQRAGMLRRSISLGAK